MRTRGRKICDCCKVRHQNKSSVCRHCELSINSLRAIELCRSMECELEGMQYLEALINWIRVNGLKEEDRDIRRDFS